MSILCKNEGRIWPPEIMELLAASCHFTASMEAYLKSLFCFTFKSFRFLPSLTDLRISRVVGSLFEPISF